MTETPDEPAESEDTETEEEPEEGLDEPFDGDEPIEPDGSEHPGDGGDGTETGEEDE